MPADTPTPVAPLDLDARVPCASCGGEFPWHDCQNTDDGPVYALGLCRGCPSEWDGVPAPVTWRTLTAYSDMEVPAAYVARLVGEVERLTAERDELAARVEQLSDRVTAAEGRLELAAMAGGGAK